MLDQLKQVQEMLQSYQSEMAKIQNFVNNLGKAPVQSDAQPSPTLMDDVSALSALSGGEEPEVLTAAQSKALAAMLKSFLQRKDDDGAKELASGLMKFGRYAQSEIDKLTAKS
jgi:hypothetical protein